MQPNVSTAGNFLTTDCFLAIVLVPLAKTMVTIDDKASGMAATAMAMANINESATFDPLNTSIPKITIAKITIAIPSFLPKSSNLF